LTWSARILDTGGVLPDVSGVTVQTGLTNLDKISPGFTLDSAHIDMPRLSEPFTVTAEGNFAGTPLQLNATIGALSRLLPGARPGEAFNLDINANVAGATFGVRGSIANPAELKGMDIALGARVPDLSLLSPFAGQALPPLNTIAFAARLVDAQGGYQRGVALKGVVLTVPQGDLSGDITLNYGGRMGVQATVTSNILDLDALNAAVNAPARSDYAQAQASGSAAALDVMTPPPLPRRQTTVISDTPLPLGLLGGGDADVHASVGEFHIGNAIYRNVAATLLLQDGNLSLSPLNAETPGGPVELRLSVDTRQPAPPVALAWHSAGLDLKPLLAAFGLPESATGKLDVDADLHATGSSPHALATTLAGHLGAAITDGDVDNAILVGALADLMGVGKPAGDAAESGHTKLRCVATRLDAAGGIATLGPTVIDTQRLQMNATGRINLGDETFALRLRPLSRGGKAGSTGLMKFEGGFREAKMEADNSPPSPAVAASSADSCALALIAARGQATAPASATPPAPRHVP
jgi:uncharacterized protein involved in outer membrane biogenesis